jgi:hypothetical protein
MTASVPFFFSAWKTVTTTLYKTGGAAFSPSRVVRTVAYPLTIPGLFGRGLL